MHDNPNYHGETFDVTLRALIIVVHQQQMISLYVGVKILLTFEQTKLLLFSGTIAVTLFCCVHWAAYITKWRVYKEGYHFILMHTTR